MASLNLLGKFSHDVLAEQPLPSSSDLQPLIDTYNNAPNSQTKILTSWAHIKQLNPQKHTTKLNSKRAYDYSTETENKRIRTENTMKITEDTIKENEIQTEMKSIFQLSVERYAKNTLAVVQDTILIKQREVLSKIVNLVKLFHQKFNHAWYHMLCCFGYILGVSIHKVIYTCCMLLYIYVFNMIIIIYLDVHYRFFEQN
jgi:hypothetical protein